MPSYKQIAKSSGLVAFVSVFQMAFGLLRNKIIAVLLGAKGFGIYGLYQVFIETAISFSSLGLDKSGVRQIAKRGDDITSRDKCIQVFTKGLLFTSIITSVICAVFSRSISESLFGDKSYYIGIIIASIAVCLRSISQGQVSILNGLRDLRSLALSQIFAAVLGSIISVLFIVFLGYDGIVLSFVSFAIASLVFSSYYVKKQKIENVKFSVEEFKEEFRILLSLGLGFSISAAVSSIFIFLSRSFIGNEFDLATVGIYQASWLISNMYIGIILSAMGVDFMPRLMKSIDNLQNVRKMVNEQMEFGSLLAGVGVMGLLLFSNIILTILYSSDFSSGSSIIKWQVLGVSLRVLGFPLAHSVMAFNKPVWYAGIQCIFALLEYLLLRLFVNIYGFDGLGISYFVAYIFFLALWIIATKKLFNFSFSKNLLYIIAFNWVGIIIAFLIVSYLKGINLYIVAILFFSIFLFFVSVLMKKILGISLMGIVKKKVLKR